MSCPENRQENGYSMSDFMKDAHPVIRYEKDCFSRGDQLMRPRKSRNYPFDKAEIVVWNWDGVDPKKESQTTAKIGDSIQRRTSMRLPGRLDPPVRDSV